MANVQTTGTEQGDINAGLINSGTYTPDPTKGPLNQILSSVSSSTVNPGQSSTSQPVTNPTSSINDALNSAQDSAMTSLNSGPLSDTDIAKAKANDIINTATSNISGLDTAFNSATTGDSSISSRTQKLYTDYGIEKPDFEALNNELASATEAYKNIQAQKIDNPTQIENRLAGGGLQTQAGIANNLGQRTIALQELAAATRMQVAQDRLNNATDIFKELSSQSATEQANYIKTISDQLSLNKDNLQAGLSLMNQALSEEHYDAMAAKSLLVGLAQNYPNFFSSLSQSDQQALTRGQITPTILATLGTLETNKQTSLDIAQQRASIAAANTFGFAPTNNIPGVDQGTPTISYDRLQQSAARIAAGQTNGLDSVATAQDMANTLTSIDQVPPKLRGYFAEKKDSLGNSYLVPKVSKAQEATFSKAYTNYVQENTTQGYPFNPVPAYPQVFDVDTITKTFLAGISQGKSVTDLKAQAAIDGVPLDVYKQALANALTPQNNAPSKTKSNLVGGLVGDIINRLK